ncbi:MAG: hypothetical protein NW206_14555 [Hyphomonadaceae bacterium]|nr:hypothetical protein [Hyphomonadaceae bacterium]
MQRLVSRGLLAVIAATMLLWSGATAHALERFGPDSVDPAMADRLDAIATIQSVMEANYSSRSCSVRASGHRLVLECSGTSAALARERLYRDYPFVGVANSPPLLNLYAAPNGRPQDQFLILSSPIETRRRLAIAWIVLAHNTVPPESEAEFRTTLGSSSSITDRAEDLRRVQVQVEAAIRANRTIDAARLYRDTLRTAPAWAEGHFNLGLLYGELELYPEAITEMRRYLYLAPNAPDVRAVQDRIYEWEAAMAPGVQ